jgi:hypothetical protein
MTVTGAMSCTADFDATGGGSPILTIVNPGGGLVFGPEIYCPPGGGPQCTWNYGTATTVTLNPVPLGGFVFTGWVGAGCATTMTITAPITCTADFSAMTDAPLVALETGASDLSGPLTVWLADLETGRADPPADRPRRTMAVGPGRREARVTL